MGKWVGEKETGEAARISEGKKKMEEGMVQCLQIFMSPTLIKTKVKDRADNKYEDLNPSQRSLTMLPTVLLAIYFVCMPMLLSSTNF